MQASTPIPSCPQAMPDTACVWQLWVWQDVIQEAVVWWIPLAGSLWDRRCPHTHTGTVVSSRGVPLREGEFDLHSGWSLMFVCSAVLESVLSKLGNLKNKQLLLLTPKNTVFGLDGCKGMLCPSAEWDCSCILTYGFLPCVTFSLSLSLSLSHAERVQVWWLWVHPEHWTCWHHKPFLPYHVSSRQPGMTSTQEASRQV